MRLDASMKSYWQQKTLQFFGNPIEAVSHCLILDTHARYKQTKGN